MKTNFLIEKKCIVKTIHTEKEKETTPQHFCVAEDCMLLEGGVLYGFTRFLKPFHFTTYTFKQFNSSNL